MDPLTAIVEQLWEARHEDMRRRAEAAKGETVSQLYEQCPRCRGTLKVQFAAAMDGGATEQELQRVGKECGCVFTRSPGYVETGLTVGQVERFRVQAQAAYRLAEQTLGVLDLQQKYFKTRATEVLHESKRAEVALRVACTEIVNPKKTAQPALFGDQGGA